MASEQPVRRDYASGEVERLLGLTQRQLSYWAATRVVEPAETRGAGTGRRLRYSHEDLVRLSVIKRLLDAGMSLQAIRRSIAFLRTLPTVHEPLREVYLSSDGTALHAHRGAEQLLEALHGGQLVFALGLEGLVRGLDAQIAALHGQQARASARSG